jgi:SAM-dependent methyltransferase
VSTAYDVWKSASYWGSVRLADCTPGDEDQEDLAVLCKDKPAEVARAYAAWERHWVDVFLQGHVDGTGLEIGCGVGRMTVDLAPRFDRYHAIDVSAEMLRRARLRVTRRGIANVEFAVCDGARLHLPDASVDTVLCIGVIEHLPTAVWTSMLAETSRVLRPGGDLLLETNNAGSVLLAATAADNPFRTGHQHDNGYFCALVSPPAVEATAAGHGLVKAAQAANPFFSLLRHGLDGVHAARADLPADAFARAEKLDRLPLAGDACAAVADQFLYRFVKG